MRAGFGISAGTLANSLGTIGVAMVLLLTSVPSTIGPIVGQSAAASGDIQTTEFHWEAPADLTGAFAAIIRIDLDGQTRCDLRIVATGTSEEDNPIVFWRSSPSGLTAAGWTRGLQAHAGPADTRILDPVGGDWWFGPSTHRLIRGSQEWTFAGFGLGLYEGAPVDSPVSIDLSCEDTVSLTLWAGREGRSFDQETLEGGIGWTVPGNPTTEWVVPRSGSIEDGLMATFPSSAVRFLSSRPFGGDDYNGTLTLEHPDGEQTWHIAPNQPSDLMSLDGASGSYRINLDWVGRDYWVAPFGILAGVNRVQSLDDVV